MRFQFLSQVVPDFTHCKNDYSAHWIKRLASVTAVEVAIASAVAIYVSTSYLHLIQLQVEK